MSTGSMEPLWSVFTKPWLDLDGDTLGKLVSGLGFAGAEVPVRDGAFVAPAAAERELPGFVAAMADHGVEVISVAADLAESTFAACRAAGVPIIRIMAKLEAGETYREGVARIRTDLEAAVPLVAEYGVGVGVQPHHGRFVTSTLGVLDLLDGLPDTFTVVWDAAHDALAGDDPRVTIPLAAERLSIVNLKQATYVPPEGITGNLGGGWHTWFGQAGAGLADWTAAFAALATLHFAGPICLTGQYSDTESVSVEDRLRLDLASAQEAHGVAVAGR